MCLGLSNVVASAKSAAIVFHSSFFSVPVVLRPMSNFLSKGLPHKEYGFECCWGCPSKRLERCRELAENFFSVQTASECCLNGFSDLLLWSIVVQERVFLVFRQVVAVPRDSLCLGGLKFIR